VNLYAAMPSLRVAWATRCAVAVITATRSRWRHLAWLYPSATVLVVLDSANHFLLDAAGREPQRQRRRSGDSCVSRPGPGPGRLCTAIPDTPRTG
jgi:hypothetical protein